MTSSRTAALALLAPVPRGAQTPAPPRTTPGCATRRRSLLTWSSAWLRPSGRVSRGCWPGSRCSGTHSLGGCWRRKGGSEIRRASASSSKRDAGADRGDGARWGAWRGIARHEWARDELTDQRPSGPSGAVVRLTPIRPTRSRCSRTWGSGRRRPRRRGMRAVPLGWVGWWRRGGIGWRRLSGRRCRKGRRTTSGRLNWQWRRTWRGGGCRWWRWGCGERRARTGHCRGPETKYCWLGRLAEPPERAAGERDHWMEADPQDQREGCVWRVEIDWSACKISEFSVKEVSLDVRCVHSGYPPQLRPCPCPAVGRFVRGSCVSPGW